MVRLQPEDLEQLDEWRRNQSDPPGRPAALRQLMVMGIYFDIERRNAAKIEAEKEKRRDQRARNRDSES